MILFKENFGGGRVDGAESGVFIVLLSGVSLDFEKGVDIGICGLTGNTADIVRVFFVVGGVSWDLKGLFDEMFGSS